MITQWSDVITQWLHTMIWCNYTMITQWSDVITQWLHTMIWCNYTMITHNDLMQLHNDYTIIWCNYTMIHINSYTQNCPPICWSIDYDWCYTVSMYSLFLLILRINKYACTNMTHSKYEEEHIIIICISYLTQRSGSCTYIKTINFTVRLYISTQS